MKKLNNGYSYIRVTAEEVEALANEMDQMVERYGWQGRTIMPWPGVKMTVSQITAQMRDFRKCTKGSKLYLIDLANGLVDIMNAWEGQELAPKMDIRLKHNGRVLTVDVEFGEYLIADGCAEVVTVGS